MAQCERKRHTIIHDWFSIKRDIWHLTKPTRWCGSWEPSTLKPLIAKYGLEYFLEDLQIDKMTENVIDDWLNGKKADKRKEYLRDHEFSIFSI